MRTNLARFTEWAWVKGRVNGAKDAEVVALEFQAWLKKSYPGQAGSSRIGLQEIIKDVTQTLRALSYGGRSAAEIPRPRLEMLQKQAVNWGWFYLRL